MAVLAPVPGQADPPSQVTVTNFPEVQAVSGHVAISDPIPQTRLETRKALVSPVALSDTRNLTDAGSIDCTGFTFVTLSLGGGLKGAGQAGTVGVRCHRLRAPQRVVVTGEPNHRGVYPGI